MAGLIRTGEPYVTSRYKPWKPFAAVAAALCLSISSPPGPARAAGPFAAPSRTVAVDFSRVKGPTSQVYRQCIGAGRANEGLRADWQRQLTYAQQKCGFQYIRMHGLFTDDMGVYSEDKSGHPVYNWQYVDRLYDFLLSIHIRPFVELGVHARRPRQRKADHLLVARQRHPAERLRQMARPRRSRHNVTGPSDTARTRSRTGTSKSGTSRI